MATRKYFIYNNTTGEIDHGGSTDESNFPTPDPGFAIWTHQGVNPLRQYIADPQGTPTITARAPTSTSIDTVDIIINSGLAVITGIVNPSEYSVENADYSSIGIITDGTFNFSSLYEGTFRIYIRTVTEVDVMYEVEVT